MEAWKVKVHPRQTVTYLWGGENVDEPTDAALAITLRVDELGEAVVFGRRDNSSSPIKTLGTLKPGESFAISLKGMRGVWAKCADPKVDTYVYCCIYVPSAG